MMDINLITVIIALVSVIITIWSVIRQTKDTHFSLGTQILLDLEKEFNTDGIKKEGLSLIRKYSKLHPGQHLTISEFSESSSVFDFFETIGILLRKRVLDIELVCSSFYYWIVLLWELAEIDIKSWRETHNDDTYWKDCCYLYNRLVKFDAHYRKIPIGKLSETELKNFIKELSD